MLFDIEHVELLGSEDGAWPGDPDPANECFSRDLVVLHSVKANQCACATQTCLAVNCHGAGVRIAEMIFAA